jgi:hypothetical protein
MTLPPPVRAAVLEVVRRLRDPMRECHVDSVGFMILEAMPEGAVRPGKFGANAVLAEVRWALNLPSRYGSIHQWARGKSREEVAQALENTTNSE